MFSRLYFVFGLNFTVLLLGLSRYQSLDSRILLLLCLHETLIMVLKPGSSYGSCSPGSFG